MYRSNDDHALAQRFRNYVMDRPFPCVGAKSAVSRGQMKFVVARDIGSACDDLRIYAGLLAFTTAYRDDPKLFRVSWSSSNSRQRSAKTSSWHFLLTPCSKDAFRIIYGDEHPHQGCFGNLAGALAPYGIGPDQIPTAFNVFMNVTIEAWEPSRSSRRSAGPVTTSSSKPSRT